MMKSLRNRKRMSQEQLAELSELSLRTIQRVEAGHRVSYSSLRALASVFKIDVDELEWELYAMDKSSDEFSEAPLWVRLFLKKSWNNANRSVSQKFEIVFVSLFAIFMILYLLPLFDDVTPPGSQVTLDIMILVTSLTQMFGAYTMCLYIRLGDKYSSWSQWE